MMLLYAFAFFGSALGAASPACKLSPSSPIGLLLKNGGSSIEPSAVLYSKPIPPLLHVIKATHSTRPILAKLSRTTGLLPTFTPPCLSRSLPPYMPTTRAYRRVLMAITLPEDVILVDIRTILLTPLAMSKSLSLPVGHPEGTCALSSREPAMTCLDGKSDRRLDEFEA
jgi:hypothetical protein